MHRHLPERYKMYKADSGALRFKIKLPGEQGQGMLSLISKTCPQKVLYDVVIGPVYIVLTIQTGTAPRDIRSLLPHPISNDFREFWITWYGCDLRLGIGSHPEPMLSYRDGCTAEYNIGYIQFHMRPSSIPIEWDFEGSPVILRAPMEKKFDDDLQWVEIIFEERNGNIFPLLPKGAMIGGFENEPIYIARAQIFGCLSIGKYVPSKCSAYFPWGENEHVAQSCEILCGMNAKWVTVCGNYIPQNAFIGGYSERLNEPVYVGRAMYENCLLVGKIHIIDPVCYLPYKGKEVSVNKYEILIRPNHKFRGIKLKRHRNNLDRFRSAVTTRQGRELVRDAIGVIRSYQQRPLNRDILRRAILNDGQVEVQRLQAPGQPARIDQGMPPMNRGEALVRAAVEHRRQSVRWAFNVLAQASQRRVVVNRAQAEANAQRAAIQRPQFFDDIHLGPIQRDQVAQRALEEVQAQVEPLRGQEGAQENQERQEMAQNAEAVPRRNQEGVQDAQFLPRELEAPGNQGIEQLAGGDRIPPEGQGMPQELRIQAEGQDARDPRALHPVLPLQDRQEVPRDLRPDAQQHVALAQEGHRVAQGQAVRFAALPQARFQPALEFEVSIEVPLPVRRYQAVGIPPPPAHAAAPAVAPYANREPYLEYVHRHPGDGPFDYMM